MLYQSDSEHRGQEANKYGFQILHHFLNDFKMPSNFIIGISTSQDWLVHSF